MPSKSLDLAQEASPLPITQSREAWKILIVDDEPDVLEATRFALKNVHILDRSLVFHWASSAQAAEAILNEHPDIAVALVDVVMETNDAGLRLVSRLREKGYRDLRLILRTGQPGYAPELQVITDFEINDYANKDDLTRTRLISLLTTTLRDYSRIRRINEHRKGLELVIESTQDLMNRKGLAILTQGILTQLAALLQLPPQGIVCAATLTERAEGPLDFFVLAGLGDYAPDEGRPLIAAHNHDTLLASAFQAAQCRKGPITLPYGLAAMFDTPGGRAYFVFVEGKIPPPSPVVSHLLHLFTTNIALCFENLDMVTRLDGLAYTDPGLKIPNRNALVQWINRIRDKEAPHRLVMFSLDTIMDIASVFGTRTASQAFLAYRDVLLARLPDVAFLGRFGDRTLLAIGAPEDLSSARLADLRAPSVPVENMPMLLPATISVLDLDLGAVEAEAVIRMLITADLAAPNQRDQDGLHHFDPSTHKALGERLHLLFALRDALEREDGSETMREDGITAHFQAKVDLVTGEITGAEALCRWTLAGRNIPPDSFIPLAETGGLSAKLTHRMIDQVAAFAERRRARGHPPLRIAINLSTADFEDWSFSEKVLEWTRQGGLSPETLSFEITEGQIMREPEEGLKALARLREAGFRLAIDDFGTGYSSLSRIDRMPITTVKIDRAFVTPLTADNHDQGIAAVAMIMARNLGLATVAEGVETADQHRALRALGCPTGQGYLYARPLDRTAFEALLEQGPLPLPTLGNPPS